MSELQIKWTIIIAHTLFWAVVAIRMGVSHFRNSRAEKPVMLLKENQPVKKISYWYGLIFYTVFTCLYYIFIGIWWFKSYRAGQLVLPFTVAVNATGIIFICIGLILMVWAYIHLNSFRFIAKIEAGHELCTDGPYKLLRHPVYAGLSLFNIGCFLLLPTFGFLIILAGLLTGSAIRASLEEKALLGAFGEQYHEYMKKTYRLIPFIY